MIVCFTIVFPYKFHDVQSKTVEDCSKELNKKTPLFKSIAIDDSQLVFNSAPATPRHRYNSFNCTSDDKTFTTGFSEEPNCQSHCSNADHDNFTLERKPFLKAIFRSLEFEDKSSNDYDTLFALGLIFAICQNQGWYFVPCHWFFLNVFSRCWGSDT